ncbi:MAG TPA: hypothetical protein VED20_04435 [Streptosporangiaceae bacterium]|nr:hypothetical protein [Streptosporangiaceae bacterium]
MARYAPAPAISATNANAAVSTQKPWLAATAPGRVAQARPGRQTGRWQAPGV